MKAYVKVRPTGLLNGLVWPEVGESVDLPSVVVNTMVDAGWLTRTKADTEVEPEPELAPEPEAPAVPPVPQPAPVPPLVTDPAAKVEKRDGETDAEAAARVALEAADTTPNVVSTATRSTRRKGK